MTRRNGRPPNVFGVSHQTTTMSAEPTNREEEHHE